MLYCELQRKIWCVFVCFSIVKAKGIQKSEDLTCVKISIC